MTYQEAVALYLQNCKSSGKSPDTISSYTHTLGNLGSHLAEINISDISDVTTPILAAWKVRRAQQLSATSMRLYLTHVRVFFDFCADMDILVKSPYKKLLDMERSALRARPDTAKEHILSEKDFRTILSNTHPKDAHKATYARNRAMLLVLLTTGIRNESLRTLCVSDIDFQNRRLHIREAKGNKSGFVPLVPVAADALRAYLGQEATLPADVPLFGFTDESGVRRPYSRTQTSNTIEAATRSLTGMSGFYSHAMRHSFASMLANRGMRTEDVSQLLFHADGSGAKVTERYIKRDDSALFEKVCAIFQRIALA